METKKCTCCCKIKPLEEFCKDKHTPTGRTCRCRQCQKEERDANPEKYKAKGKKYRDTHQEEIKQYVKDNKEKLDAYQKDYRVTYYQENKEAVDNKNKLWMKNNRRYWLDWLSSHRKKKRREDSLYRAKEAARGAINSSIKRKGYTKKSRTYEILGCEWDFFVVYFEGQFDKHMTWENHGSYWEIDHINPLKDAHTYEDVEKWNHYTNLRPLKIKQNREKSGNRPDEDYQFRLL